MSRELRWLNESTDDVREQLVRAARRSEPDPAAHERLLAVLRCRSGAIGGRKARPATRLISSVLGWTASAAAMAPAAGKGLAMGGTLSVIKWAGVGAIVGLSTVGVASRTGIIRQPGTPPISTEVPVGSMRMAPAEPPVTHVLPRTPPASASDGLESASASSVAAGVPAPPEKPWPRAVAEPTVPVLRPPVVNPVAARLPNSIGPVQQVEPAGPQPADTEPAGPQPADTEPATASVGPLPSLAAPSGATLAVEVSALDAARASLRAGDAAGALRVLSDYRERFPRGALADEASLVGITAWLAMGRRDAASVEAERLLARKPPPALEERIRKLMNVR